MLFLAALRALDGGDLLGILDHLHDGGLVFGTGHQVGQDGAFRRQQEEAATEQRVRTGGEHGDEVVLGGVFRRIARAVAQGELHLGALGTADPVRLLLLDALGPTLERVQVIEQLLGVIGDLEVPLRQVALLHLAVAAPATAFGDLLVGEHGAAAGAPVHRAVAAFHQPALVELLEDPLAPAIVFRVARDHGAVPVVGKAHALERRLLRLDVGVGPLRGVALMLDGRIFRRKAERIPAHRMQNVEAAHLRIAGDDVADGVVAHVAHVDIARRIREHLEHVLLRLRRILGHLVEVGLGPRLLPAGFDLVRIVLLHRLIFLATL